MERVGVRERVLVRDLSIERELVDSVEADLFRSTCPGATAVAADVDEDAREPRRRRGGVLEPVEGSERLEQRVLYGIFRIVTDESPGDPVQARELALGRTRKRSVVWLSLASSMPSACLKTLATAALLRPFGNAIGTVGERL